MTAIDILAPTINIRERYRDVVSDRWPVIVAPQSDELLSSWLHRLAYANGVAPRAFARVLGLSSGMWSASLDLRLPTDVASLLGAHTGISPQQLSAMMLLHAMPKQLLLPLRNSGRREASTWLQFCSRCLAEDAQPYFRRRWRLATRVTCTRHGYRLRDRCPSCQSRVAVFDQTELAPQHYCVCCGYDLRGASIVGVSPAAKLLDQCVDDILRLEAITGSTILVRRLLSIPSLADIYQTMILTSLSTSMRTRCIEQLTHHPMIEPLANALGRKRGRKVATNDCRPAVRLRVLLSAYAQIEGRPSTCVDRPQKATETLRS